MKNKYIIAVAVIFIIAAVIGGLYLFRPASKNSKVESAQVETKNVQPSETLIQYNDPSGFSFSYPDNLSIENKQTEDSEAYSDLQLYSNDVSGSINIRITDTKLKNNTAWLDEEKIASSEAQEKMLGDLEALEVKTSDRLRLASVDQGILFLIEVPLVQEDFWNQVYSKITETFAFAAPETKSTSQSGVNYSDVIFEGEEVVE